MGEILIFGVFLMDFWGFWVFPDGFLCFLMDFWDGFWGFWGQVEYDGLTGRVEFNSKGQRTNYSLRVLEKGRDGHREVGQPLSDP